MGGICAFLNPAAPPELGISVFYNNDRGNLCHEQRGLADPEKIGRQDYLGSAADPQGLIMPSSHIATAVKDGVNLVFAIIQEPPSKVDSVRVPAVFNRVSVVSPSYQSTSALADSQLHTLAATTRERPIIYSIRFVLYTIYASSCPVANTKSSKGAPVNIVRTDVHYSSTGEYRAIDIKDGSGLAAYCADGQSEFVIYQNTYNDLGFTELNPIYRSTW